MPTMCKHSFFLSPFYACIVGIRSKGKASPKQRQPLAGAYSGRAGRRLTKTRSSPQPLASRSSRSGMASSPLTSLQGARVCPLDCDCGQRRASRDPGRLCSRTEVGWHGGCPLPGEQAASAPKRPPTSMSMTTRRQRSARVSSGYVSRLLRRAALSRPIRLCVSSGARLTRPRHGRDYGGIKGEL